MLGEDVDHHLFQVFSYLCFQEAEFLFEVFGGYSFIFIRFYWAFNSSFYLNPGFNHFYFLLYLEIDWLFNFKISNYFNLELVIIDFYLLFDLISLLSFSFNMVLDRQNTEVYIKFYLQFLLRFNLIPFKVNQEVIQSCLSQNNCHKCLNFWKDIFLENLLF